MILVYATCVYTKNCITDVPKIFLDIKVAHFSVKLISWFWIYRMGAVVFLSIYCIFNFVVFDLAGDVSSNLKVFTDILTEGPFTYLMESFKNVLESTIPTVYCSEETDSSNYKGLPVFIQDSKTDNSSAVEYKAPSKFSEIVKKVQSDKPKINPYFTNIPKNLIESTSEVPIYTPLVIGGSVSFANKIIQGTPGASIQSKTAFGLIALGGSGMILLALMKEGNKVLTNVSSRVATPSLASKKDTDSSIVANTNNNNIGTNMDNTNTSTNPYIHSPLEEENSTSFLASIYDFLFDWMKSNYSERIPFDTEVNLPDYSTFHFDFVFLQFLVVVLYTAGYYFVLVGFLHLSLSYIYKKVSSVNKFNIVKFITALLEFIIQVIKVISLLLFTTILAVTMYLYTYCNIPFDLVNYIINNIEAENILFTYTFYDISMYKVLNFMEKVLVFSLVYYRYKVVIKPLNYGATFEFLLALPCIFLLRYTTELVMNTVKLSGNNESTTLVEIFTGYNACIKLLFYSLIIFTIAFTIEYICDKKSNIIREKMGTSSKYLFYNIAVIFVKVTTSLAFFSASQGILALYGYYIPSEVFLFL